MGIPKKRKEVESERGGLLVLYHVAAGKLGLAKGTRNASNNRGFQKRPKNEIRLLVDARHSRQTCYRGKSTASDHCKEHIFEHVSVIFLV